MFGILTTICLYYRMLFVCFIKTLFKKIMLNLVLFVVFVPIFKKIELNFTKICICVNAFMLCLFNVVRQLKTTQKYSIKI